MWSDLSASPSALRYSAAHADGFDALVAARGSRPVVYAITPCRDGASCCMSEVPRLARPDPASGGRAVTRRASSAPPRP